MGSKHSKPKKEIKPERIIDFQKIYENIDKRKLNEPSDFSIKHINQKAIQLFEDAKIIEGQEQKISILEEAISYDNTNEAIIKDYLQILKSYNQENFKKEIEKYYYHISEKTYIELLGEEKKFSSVKLLSELFDKFKSYKICENDNLEEIKNDISKKYNFTQYFYLKKKVKLSISANSTFTIQSNFELALYEVYISLFKEINDKIDKVWKLCNNTDMNLEKKLNYICPKGKNNYVKYLINNLHYNENIALLFHSNLYTYIFINIKNYICQLDEIINSCLKFKDLEKDFYILLFIILEIKIIIFEEEKISSKFIEKLKKYNKDYLKTQSNNEVEIKDNNEIIDNKINISNEIKDSKAMIDKKINISNEIKDDKAIFDKNINNDEIKDNYKYYMDKIINFKKITENNSIPDTFILDKFIKIEYFNTNNYITKMKLFIDNFNNSIANSKTIVSCLCELYPELKNKKIFESEFTKNLFNMAFKNCYYFPFSGRRGAITLEQSGTILFFIPNRTKIKRSSLIINQKKTYYILANLGLFIYIEFHEILGHFLRIILSKIIDYKYKSPRSTISKKNEIGECIESYLFGKRFENFNIKQLIYLLDIYNYNKNYREFSNDFQNINSLEYIPSKDFMNMIKFLELDLSLIDIDDKNEIGYLFKEKYIYGNNYIEVPTFYNCCEHFELGQDEDLINLLKSKDDLLNSIHL